MTRRLPARDLALVATFAALIAVLGLPGQLNLFGNAVPVTAQTLGVMLAGALLGARRGALAVLVFCVLVVLGLPLLAGGRGGLSVLTSPSAGYFIGFTPGAFVIGVLLGLWRGRFALAWALVAIVVGGLGVVYAIGMPVHAWIAGVPLSKVLVTRRGLPPRRPAQGRHRSRRDPRGRPRLPGRRPRDRRAARARRGALTVLADHLRARDRDAPAISADGRTWLSVGELLRRAAAASVRGGASRRPARRGRRAGRCTARWRGRRWSCHRAP